MHLSLTGPAVDSGIRTSLALVAAVVVLLILRRLPRTSAAIWVVTLCFVPIWIGLNAGLHGNLFVPAISAVSLLVFIALLPAHGFRFVIVDGMVLLLFVLGVLGLFAGNSGIALSTLTTFLVYFVPGYILGRLLPLRVRPEWIYGCIGVVFTVVAIMTLIEFFTSWNPFVLIKADNSLYQAWGTIQSRGGVLRAEGAFGHSIALGSSLAIAVPLTLASRFPSWTKILMVGLMSTATVFTFSRIGMITAVLGIVLILIFLRGTIPIRTRAAVIAAIVIVSAIVVPTISTVFGDAGSEATDSAAYRGDLLSLVGSMSVIGVAGSAQRDAAGQLYFGNFASIDSQLILTGLTVGIVALLIVVVALIGAILLMLRRRASAPTIALVAQIPALATVALITQYSVFFWFLIGLAASTQWLAHRRSVPDGAELRGMPTALAHMPSPRAQTRNNTEDMPVAQHGT